MGIPEISAESILFNKGLHAKELMKSPVFQDAVKDVYLALILQEDALDLSHDEGAKELRMQRRLLRQVIANLDNKVSAFEAQEAQRLLDLEQKKYDGGVE